MEENIEEKKSNTYGFENPVYVETKQELDNIGPGMCSAKWTQVTLQLQNGHNHSCHHPKTHKISKMEIARNPSALHNTRYKKLRRKEMLHGARPEECDYCWGVEDNSDRFSDRIFKSAESWSRPFFKDIVGSDWRDDFNPRYVEVAFSNTCNFKCSYCGPAFSTTWMEEIDKFGGYSTSTNFNDPIWLVREDKAPLKQTEHNPYTEAFWKWWPDLYKDLHTFRITGGEPLLAKDTWKVLDYIIDHPNPNTKLNLSINSNLGAPDVLIDKFIDKVNKIIDGGKINEFIIFTSADAWGEQAEYIRNGLEFNRFWGNVNKILTKCPRVVITFMVTYNALSVFSYDRLIKGVYDLKKEYGSSDRYWPSAVMLDSSYLRFPWHQTVQILPRDFKENILEHAKLALYYGVPKFDHKYIGYSDVEIQKLKRIYDWSLAKDADPKNILQHQKDFAIFFAEHDKRRGTNFVKTFPELEEFYNFCKTITI
jgi:MoaA/NifB/PqqE/SkfB family radical SAM enzyme